MFGPPLFFFKRLFYGFFELIWLDPFDPKGGLRTWLGSRYTPEAIRQGLSIFATQRAKERLHSDTAHRYLVKVIENCQDEIDLRQQEDYLREYAEVEKRGMLRELESEYALLKAQCDGRSGPANDLAFQLSEKAVFGGIILQRSFWEAKLKKLLIESKTESRPSSGISAASSKPIGMIAFSLSAVCYLGAWGLRFDA